MKPANLETVLGAVVVLLSASPSLALKGHHHLPHVERSLHHLHVRHTEENAASSAPVVKKKRSGQCAFPTDDPNLVAITPDSSNAGWAMSPDQTCDPGSYCPFACKPGMVMAQWQEGSSYVYPSSMNGGLYCNDDGEIEKPFSDQPNCVDGTGAVTVVNKCSEQMSWCQTVLPGNEAMLIPTVVESSASIAVPGSSYWCSTAAHFYINPPGTGSEGCVWGSDSEPIGNWSPYVAGANTDSSGLTYVKLGINPIWQDSSLVNTAPTFGLEVVCPDGGCNGLPCKIDPSISTTGVESSDSAVGAGGASFCVVTVPSGGTAQIVAFDAGSSGDDSSDTSSVAATSSAAPSSTEPESSTVPPTTSTPEPTTTSQEPTTTSEAPETTSTSEAPSTTSTSTSTTSHTPTPTPTFSSKKKTSSSKTTTVEHHKTLKGGIFQENGTTASTDYHYTTTEVPSSSATLTEAAPTTSKKGEAGRQQGSAAVAGLVVAFIAAACFF